jgi:hypothetical protein
MNFFIKDNKKVSNNLWLYLAEKFNLEDNCIFTFWDFWHSVFLPSGILGAVYFYLLRFLGQWIFTFWDFWDSEFLPPESFGTVYFPLYVSYTA